MTKTELKKLRDRILVVKCKVYTQLCKGIRKHKTYSQLVKMWKSVDAKLNSNHFDIYCDILLGERVNLAMLTIDGVDKHSEQGIHFTKKIIRELRDAHADGKVVKAKTNQAWFDTFLQTPLPADLKDWGGSFYCQALREAHS